MCFKNSTQDSNNDTPDASGTNQITQQLTHFVDDREIVTTTLPSTFDNISATQNVLELYKRHDIISILERPHQIDTIELKSSAPSIPFAVLPAQYTTNVGRLAKYDFPKKLIAVSNIKSKLSNFNFLRADVEVTVRVNATPFHQGRLWLTFSPYADAVSLIARGQANEHCSAISNFPGTELDIGSSNIASLVIPYCSPMQAYDIANDVGSMGTFAIYVLIL